jgi:hypothetical protein
MTPVSFPTLYSPSLSRANPRRVNVTRYCCSVGRPTLRQADAAHSSSGRPAAGGQVSSGRLSHRHHHLGERQVTTPPLNLCPDTTTETASVV